MTSTSIDALPAESAASVPVSVSGRGAATSLLYIVIAAMVGGLTAQRSFFPHPHWTYWIFRSSFWHLLNGWNLYAHYGSNDLFKYSPTAALLFAPFAVFSLPVGMLLWNAFNVGVLIFAFHKLFPARQAALALLLALPELFNATQASQSNAVVAALILLAFWSLENRRVNAAAVAIAVGTAIKLFPIAALSLSIFYPWRKRIPPAFTLCVVALFLLPLAVTSPAMLQAQYGWWLGVESSDAIARGASVMRVLHQLFRVDWPNWPVQLAGVLILLAPLLRRSRWIDIHFRRSYLASLLVFVVIFNHQAETPSFIIAATGAAIWYLWSPRGQLRLALVLFGLTGLYAWGYLPIWIAMQAELHGAELPAWRLWPESNSARSRVAASSMLPQTAHFRNRRHG